MLKNIHSPLKVEIFFGLKKLAEKAQKNAEAVQVLNKKNVLKLKSIRPEFSLFNNLKFFNSQAQISY